MRRLISSFLILTLSLGQTAPLFAYSNNDALKTISSDGSQSDTQAAISYADGKNQDGWVLTVGSAGGSYTWTSGCAMASTFTHSFTITSAGGIANPTSITMNFTSSGTGLGLMTTNGKLTNLYGFTFHNGSGQTLGTGIVNVDNSGTTDAHDAFHIYGNSFPDCNLAITVLYPNKWNTGTPFGLIDRNTFAHTSAHSCIYVYGGTSTGADSDLGQWLLGMTWGTSDTVTIQNNTASLTGADTVEGLPFVDSAYFGPRLLIRNNDITNMVVVSHGADSAPSSTLQVELYHNTFHFNRNDAIDFVAYSRGGVLRMWDNTVIFTNGATANQILKVAVDHYASRSLGFQAIGRGAVAGTETLIGDNIWGNTVTGATVPLVGSPNSPNTTGDTVTSYWVLNTHYFLTAPGSFSELGIHPLDNSGGTPAAISNGSKQRLAPSGSGF